jgi:hypothetical protein
VQLLRFGIKIPEKERSRIFEETLCFGQLRKVEILIYYNCDVTELERYYFDPDPDVGVYTKEKLEKSRYYEDYDDFEITCDRMVPDPVDRIASASDMKFVKDVIYSDTPLRRNVCGYGDHSVYRNTILYISTREDGEHLEIAPRGDEKKIPSEYYRYQFYESENRMPSYGDLYYAVLKNNLEQINTFIPFIDDGYIDLDDNGFIMRTAVDNGYHEAVRLLLPYYGVEILNPIFKNYINL